MKKAISVILTVAVIISCLTTAFSVMAQAVENIAALNEKEKVIIEFKDSSVLESLANLGMERNESKEKIFLNKLNERRKNYLVSISKLIGDFEVDYTYSSLFNGVSIECTKKNEQKLKKLTFIKNIYEVSELQILTNTSKSTVSGAVDTMDVIDVSELRKLGYDGTGTAVAVIDIDMQTNHPALKLTNPSKAKYTKEKIAEVISLNEMNSSNISADACYVSSKVPFAFDYEENDNNVLQTLYNHGTHVAGIIAGNNNVIQGVAPEAQILMFKVSNTVGSVFLDNLLAALDDASKFDVDAINMSVGWSEQTAMSSANQLIGDVVTTAKNNGIVVCAASGNSAVFSTDVNNPDNSISGVPATIQDVFSVGAADNDGVASYSSYGVSEDLKLTVDIVAPGTGVYSSVAGNAYSVMDGTSMSSPHVAGAALIMSQYVEDKYPDADGREKSNLIENLLSSSAVPVKQSGTVDSPRVQGAGLMNLSNVTQTNVILTGEENRCSVNLGDELGDKLEFSFFATNISSSYIVYDSVSEQTVTDAYSFERRTNQHYLNQSSEVIASTYSINSGNPIQLEPGETKEITVTINLDKTKLSKNKQIFTNGFYVEGFVFLKDTTGKQSSISIPFMGFNGDWGQVPSVEITDDKLSFSALRTLKELEFELLDGEDKVVLTNTKEYVLKGTEFYSGIWLFENFSDDYTKLQYPKDGDYTIRVTATAACDDASPETWTMPLTLNASNPSVTGYTYDIVGDEIYIRFYTDTNEINRIVITGGSVFNFKYKKSVDIESPDDIDGYGYSYSIPVDSVMGTYVYEFKMENHESIWAGSYSILCRLFRWIFGIKN